MRKIQRINVEYPVEYNADFNQAVGNVVQNILQQASPGPIGYKPCRTEGGSPIPRRGKWARHVGPDNVRTETASRFNTHDLEVYERMLFGCLAWGDYSTYVITGEMGSGKTSVARWIREVLERERTALCTQCRNVNRTSCTPLVISRDFNTYALIDSVSGLEHIFRKDLLAVVQSVLRNIFSVAGEVENLRLLVIKRPADTGLARFAGFVQYCARSFDWAQLEPQQKADRLLDYVERDLMNGDGRDLDEQILYAMTLLSYVKDEVRHDPACIVFIFDNIDSLRPDAQLALLKIIVSAQETAHIKTLVPLRLTTFEKWESNAAFVFGHIDHAGAGPMEIIRERLIWWQTNWDSREDVRELEPALYRDALKKRLDYFLELWEAAPRTIDALGALCGASIRLGLYLMERVFVNNVIRFDGEAHYHDEILRCVLVDNGTRDVEMSAQDLYVHNVFASPVDNGLSLALLRILQVTYALKDIAGQRTVSNILRTVQTADLAFTEDLLWRAINSLLFQKAPLVWVDGKYGYPTAADAFNSLDVLTLTEAGRRHIEVLLRELMYVQEALMSVAWPVQKVGRYVNYKRMSSRFNALHDGLLHVMDMDKAQMSNWLATRGQRSPMISVDGEFISNRILYNVGRSVLGIVRRSEFERSEVLLVRWKELIERGFNAEWSVLQQENLKLVELSEDIKKEIVVRAAAGAVSAVPVPEVSA